MGALAGMVDARPVEIVHWTGGPEGERLQARDSWFHSHYVFAPHVIYTALAPHVDLSASRVLDLGCGDGIMALGMRKRGVASVAATDLTRAFDALPRKAQAVLGLQAMPQGLDFRQGQLGQPLPYADGEFDAVYSWSVFEHVSGVEWLMREVVRVLRPGGALYLQIEPLYYSPFGSHLMRLIEEPWAHLLHSDEAYLAMATAASDHTTVAEMDLLYRSNEFAEVKRYLIGEYRSLNRLRTVELIREVRAAGLGIQSCELSQVRQLSVPQSLREQHSEHDLITNEIRLVIRRT
jgi:ubiquinone/menaquinone biosynthesis C-methylase UbiE